MVLLDATTELRRSELFALKWSDVDFSNLELNVTRSIYLRTIGNCKTEASRKPVPIDIQVAADQWLWPAGVPHGIHRFSGRAICPHHNAAVARYVVHGATSAASSAFSNYYLSWISALWESIESHFRDKAFSEPVLAASILSLSCH